MNLPLSHAEERVLFAFDDHSIPWQHNLKVTLVPATKHPGNPVLRRGPEGAPDHGHAILYGTVIKDRRQVPHVVSRHDPERSSKRGQAPGWWRPMCYAESADGVHWTKPELGLVEFNGSKKNNICLIEGEPFSLTRVNDFLSVLHDPDDPDPARRYKAAYIAHLPYDDIPRRQEQGRHKGKRVGLHHLRDQRRWPELEGRGRSSRRTPAASASRSSSLYRFGDFYYPTGQLISPWTWRAGRPESMAGRVMLAYRSPDFKTWSQAKAFAFARPGPAREPADCRASRRTWARACGIAATCCVGLYGMWQDAPAAPPKGASHLLGVHIDLGLVVSNDGIHFREPVPDFKVIARGKEGEWDDIALLQGHAFANEGDKTMIWYSHWDTGGEAEERWTSASPRCAATASAIFRARRTTTTRSSSPARSPQAR